MSSFRKFVGVRLRCATPRRHRRAGLGNPPLTDPISTMKTTPLRVVMSLTIALLVQAAAAAPASQPSATNPQWQEVAPGVWKAVIGTPDDLTLFSAAGITPKLDALKAMPSAPFPLEQKQIEAR